MRRAYFHGQTKICRAENFIISYHIYSINYFISFIALKLPLCKVKKEFAEQHGIRQQTAPAPAPVVPARAPSFSPTLPPQRSQSSFNREADTLIVTPSDAQSNLPARLRPSRPENPPAPLRQGGSALKSTLLDRYSGFRMKINKASIM